MAKVDYRAVVNTALAEIGYQGGKTTSKYSAELDAVQYYNYPKNGEGGASWCKIFVDWCVFVNNNRDPEKTRLIMCEPANHKDNCGAGCTQAVQYFKSKGRYYTKSSDATTGDEIFFKRSDGAIYHTGIVVDWGHFDGYGDGFMVVEGNTNGNQVAKKFYSYGDSKIAGFGRPDWYRYEDEAPEPEPTPEPPKPSKELWKVTTNGGVLRLRSAPNTSSANLIGIPNGTVLEVTDIVQGEPIKYDTRWAKTCYGGYNGYAACRWMTKL